MKKLLAVILGLAILFGCVSPPPTQGYVRDKRFVPAHWEDGYRTEHYTDCGMHFGYDGKYHFSCEDATRQVYEEHHEWVEDAWSFYLEDCKRDDKGKEKCHRGWRQVSGEVEYNQYGIGDHYPDRR